jgi:hypothetical protein
LPAPTGNPTAISQQAQQIVESVLQHPNRTRTMFFNKWARLRSLSWIRRPREMEPSQMEARPVSGLLVRFVKSTEAGRLYPRYDDESGIVVAESRVVRDWPYGIDVDGSLICDLDEHHVLANVDLHIPRPHWSRDESVRWPTARASGDLVFLEATVRTKSFGNSVKAISDPAGRVLEIRIG